MKRAFLTLIMAILVCTVASAALTQKQIDNQQMEASVNIIISQYNSAKQVEVSSISQLSNYQKMLKLNGINWSGFNTSAPSAVNWSQYGPGNP